MQIPFKNLSIKTRLYAWVALLFIFLAATLLVSYVRGGALSELFGETKEEIEEMRAVTDALLSVYRADMLVHDFIISGIEPGQKEKDLLEKTLQSAEFEIGALEGYSTNLTEESELFVKIKRDLSIFEDKGRVIFNALRDKGHKASEIALMMQDADIVSGNMSANIETWREFNKKEVAEVEKEALGAQSELMAINIFLVSFVVGISLVLVIMLVLFIKRSINRLIKAAKEISNGNLQARADIDLRGEIGEFAQVFNKMAEDLELAKKDNEKHEADLEKNVRQLQILNKAMVGRELEMVELKKKIKEMENKK